MKKSKTLYFAGLLLIAIIVLLFIFVCDNGADAKNQKDLSTGLEIATCENDAEIDSFSSTRFTTNGKSRVVLQKHFYDNGDSNGKPIITQADFSETNTIYVVRYDFVLGEDIEMPANCIIEFEGGSLSGGTITGNNTSIVPADYSIFNDCVVKKFNLQYVDPRWVGAVPDFNEQTRRGTDNSVYFQMAHDNIVENHPGIDILVVGKYLINKSVIMRKNCHLRGVHNNTRGLVKYGLKNDTGSSISLIAVDECPAFRVVGDVAEERTWADFSIEHIKFVGLNRKKSIAIQYEAAGSPTRPASIEKCEASDLQYFLYIVAKSPSTIGNLTISGNNIYHCEKAIYAVSNPSQHGGVTSLKIENNVIEHNGDKCIYLNKCFGPIIIDNNILEGESNPIYLTSTYYSETNYVISYNYFEQPSDDDKKIHIDGYITDEGGNYDHAYFLTNVEIYGNTSVHGFAVELNGVVVRRLDRIDNPSKGRTNYSTFTRCLFEDIELSDVYACQLKDWNFSTRYPTSIIQRNHSLIGSSGNELLSFDDCKGTAHMNKNTEVTVPVKGDVGNHYNLLITKMRPRFTEKNKKIILNYSLNKKDHLFAAALPREIPYYAFLVYKKDTGVKKNEYELKFTAYNKGSDTDIEVGNITIYKNVEGALYKYPHILLPYEAKK